MDINRLRISIGVFREVKIGLRLPQTGQGHATKENFIRLAKGAETAGFDSLWVL